MKLNRDDGGVVAVTLAELALAQRQIEFARSSDCPDDAGNPLIGAATRNAILALETLRDQFGFDPAARCPCCMKEPDEVPAAT